MKTINKISAVSTIAFALVTAYFVGGVQVEAITASQNIANFKRLREYLKFDQPAQIKRDIAKTVAKYRKNGKSYDSMTYQHQK